MSTVNWQSDWLYTLILREAEKYWKMCTPSEDDWQYVLIAEREAEEGGVYIGNTVRSWIRDINGLKEISVNEHAKHIGKIQGGLYPFIIMGFYISPDRKHVIIGHQEGSRSGMGNEYIVRMHNNIPKLELNRSGNGWVS